MGVVDDQMGAGGDYGNVECDGCDGYEMATDKGRLRFIGLR